MVAVQSNEHTNQNQKFSSSSLVSVWGCERNRHQGAVPAPQSFDIDPPTRKTKKNYGGRQKEMVRLLFGKANQSQKLGFISRRLSIYCPGPRIPTNIKNCLGYFMPCPNKRKGHDDNSPGLPERTRRILQEWSLSNQMNTPIRIKNFLLLQRFANQYFASLSHHVMIQLSFSASSVQKDKSREIQINFIGT